MGTQIGIAGASIYSSDGSLTGARTLTLNGNPLTIVGTASSRYFANGNVGINTTTDEGWALRVNGSASVNSINGPGTSSLVAKSHVGAGAALIVQYSSNQNAEDSARSSIAVQGTFNPANGAATFAGISLSNTINQTGGSTGISRGVYVNPTLTSAVDFRAIETTNGKVIFGGTGNVLIGTTTDAGFKLDVNGNTRISGTLSAGGGTATSGGSIALGTFATTGGNFYACAIGYEATASNSHGIAIGYGAIASGLGSYAFGRLANASELHSTAFSNAQANGVNSVAYGFNSLSEGNSSMAGGASSYAYLTGQLTTSGGNFSYRGDSQYSIYTGGLNTGVISSGGTYSFAGIRPSNGTFSSGVTQIWYAECVVVFAVKGRTAAITEFALRDTYTIKYKLAIKSTDGVGTTIIGTPIADSSFSDASMAATSVTFTIVSNNLVVSVTPPTWASGGQMQFRGTASFQLTELGVYSQPF